MLYRHSSQLALQAALLLAAEDSGKPRRVRDLAAALNVPATYLAKVLQGLIRVGLLRTVRGPGGGVRLARPAREIRLWDVLEAVEPAGELEGCCLGLKECSDRSPCPLHDAWARIRSQILAMLQSRSLWDFATGARGRGLMTGSVGSGDGVEPEHTSVELPR